MQNLSSAKLTHKRYLRMYWNMSAATMQGYAETNVLTSPKKTRHDWMVRVVSKRPPCMESALGVAVKTSILIMIYVYVVGQVTFAMVDSSWIVPCLVFPHCEGLQIERNYITIIEITFSLIDP